MDLSEDGPYLVRLTEAVPGTILLYAQDPTRRHIYDAWCNQPVEPYGKEIPPQGSTFPYSAPLVAVRLGVPGAAAFTVCALEEFAEPLDWNLVPDRPSYSGAASVGCSTDTALGRD